MPQIPRVVRRLALLGALSATGAGLALFSASVPTASADPSPSAWYSLRMCESGNNYSINTGNGHYGAYQFDLSTWRSVGGTGYPSRASAAEQDARALILYRERGWQPWQCASILGLREDGDARSGRISDIHVPTTGTSTPPVTPPSTGGVPAWPGPRYYGYGDHSTTIQRFQNQLHARGVFPVGTGDFGPHTLAAVKTVQRLNGLSQTGILGPVTWKLAWTGKVAESVAAPTAPVTTTPVSTAPAGSAPAWPGPQYFSYGDHSTTIQRFQNQLHARGVFPVGTGDFGPNTLATVKRVQALNHLPQTGILGPVTWKLAWTGKV